MMVAAALVVLLGVLQACGGGGGAPADNAFPQTLTDVSPASGTTAGGTEITLSGTGFLDPLHTIRQIRFGAVEAGTWQILSDETIVVESPPGVVGPTVISLLGDNASSPDGVLLSQGFTYVAPLLYVAQDSAAVDPRLYTVDLTTGATGIVGSIGYAIRCMAMGPDGMLYAVEEGSFERLIRINPLSGEGTVIAAVRDAVTELPVDLVDATFLDGRLICRTAGTELVEIDLLLGDVHPFATVSGLAAGGAVAASGVDSLYVVPGPDTDQLYLYDVGAGTTSGGAALAQTLGIQALAFSNAKLYGLVPDLAMILPPTLFAIDPLTGALLPLAELPAASRAVARDR